MFEPKAIKELKKAAKLTRGLIRRYRKRIPEHDLAALNAELDACDEIVTKKETEKALSQLETLHTASEAHLGPHRNPSWYENVESIGIAVVIALVLRAFVIEAFTIPSGSMIPTLAVGDFLFVNKLAYGTRVPFTENKGFFWDAPDRGDIIVFVYPCNTRQDYIKRVVAVEGDIVEPFGGKNNSYVAVNGVPLVEEKLRDFDELSDFKGGELGTGMCPNQETLHLESSDVQSYSTLHCHQKPNGSIELSGNVVSDWGAERARAQACPSLVGFNLPAKYPWRVPKGHVFVMGDNRDNSQDSRFWGFVPVESVKGKALFMWLSWDGSASWSRPWEKVRWNRLFRPVHRVYEGK